MEQPQRHPMLSQAFALAQDGRGAEAIAIIERLAATGDPESLFTLGDAYWRGAGVKQDMGRGRELFKMAAAAGNPIALRAYTNLLASGNAGARDWAGALRRLTEEARDDGRRALMLSLIGAMDLDPDGEPRSIPAGRRLSDSPQIALFEGALTRQECDFLILVAGPSFEPSLVGNAPGPDIRDPVRTSDGATLHWLIEDPAIHAINRRLAALSGTRAEQGEPLQILRYQPGQQYRRHFDWLGKEKARIFTALVYLNDEYEGGETEFHKASLKIRGRMGDVLVFKSLGPDGELDPMTEHAGLPVTKGVKYLASRWIRAHRMAP